jgi:hypothetical protein
VHNVVCSILDAKCIIYNAVYHANYIVHNALCIHVWTDCYIFSGVQIFFTNFSPDASYIVIRFILKDAVNLQERSSRNCIHDALYAGRFRQTGLDFLCRSDIVWKDPHLTCISHVSHMRHKCVSHRTQMQKVLETYESSSWHTLIYTIWTLPRSCLLFHRSCFVSLKRLSMRLT